MHRASTSIALLLPLCLAFITLVTGNASDVSPKRGITIYLSRNDAEAHERVPMQIDPDRDDIEWLKVRAGIKLGYVPIDCTEYSPSRPRRTYEQLTRAPEPALEPSDECSYTSWAIGIRLYDYIGRLLYSARHLRDGDMLFVVPPQDLFMWHGGHFGRRVVMPHNVLPDGEPIEVVTLSMSPRIFLIPRFVSDAEADQIVSAAKARLRRSTVVQNGAAVISSRTSENTWMQCEEDGVRNEAICALDERIARTTNVPLRHIRSHSEKMQVLRYRRGAHYWNHYDWADKTKYPEEARTRLGQVVNRFYTLFFYLSDVESGGETAFPQAGPDGYKPGEFVPGDICDRGIRVRPKKGAAVLWYHLRAPGNGHEAFPDLNTLHAGCDVINGTKWAANKWVHNHMLEAEWEKESWRAPLPLPRAAATATTNADEVAVQQPSPRATDPNLGRNPELGVVHERFDMPVYRDGDVYRPRGDEADVLRALTGDDEASRQAHRDVKAAGGIVPGAEVAMGDDDLIDDGTPANSAKLTLLNKGQTDVNLLWVNEQSGEEVLLGDARAAGGGRQVNTFLGHRFVVRRAEGGDLVDEITVTDKAQDVIVT